MNERGRAQWPSLNGTATISIVIPTYNRREILLATVDMLLPQLASSDELIIVDQSPSVPAHVNSRLTELSGERQIQWIRQSEANASLARNAGAAAASGDVIVFLDDDVRVDSNFIEAYRLAFSDVNVLAVAGQVLEGDGETVESIDPRCEDSDIGWLYCKRNYSKPYIGDFIMAGNMGVRRAPFLQIGGMDARFTRGAFREEADFAMRWRKSGRTIHYCPSVSLYHLGGAIVAYGGARDWTQKTQWVGWHHYFGSWYFLFRHGTLRSAPKLLAIDLRSAGVNRRTFRRPWMLPLHLCRWLSAAPFALAAALQGPLLLTSVAEH